MSKLLTSPVRRGGVLRNSVLGMAIATALALPQVAAAYEFDLGSEDLTFRWDNTLRVNIADRTAGQNKDMIANANYDDADRNFDTGSIWTRFDVYSEMDLVWKPSWGTLGARVSAAGWWDPGYQSLDNTSIQTQNTLKGGYPELALSDYTDRYAQGPSGEFMDWFLFTSFNIGEAPVNVKVGQTTVYWGESLLSNGAFHGVSYSQNPIDVWKALATPGAEVKELFRPRVGLNINSQVTDTVNVALQYFFNWQQFSNQAYRYPESGSYLSVGDSNVFGADSTIAGRNPLYAGSPVGFPGSQQWLRLWHGNDYTPDENSGNYGVAVRWAPEWADATFGFYYRRTYDMQPTGVGIPDLLTSASPALPLLCGASGGAILQPGACLLDPAANLNDFLLKGRAGEYGVAFGSDVDIYGVSLSKNLGGMSLGAELSYRSNMPLLSETVLVLPDAFGTFGALQPGQITVSQLPKNDSPGAKGDTMHGLVNLLGIVGESIWDTASWAAELTWMSWLDVTQNEAVFKGRGKAQPGKWTSYDWAIDKVDKNYFGLAFNFTPTWFQVRPGMDILAPISWFQGISGNSAITGSGQEGAGSFGLGIALDFYQRYRFDLKYVGQYGDYQRCNSVPGGNTAASRVATCVGGNPSDVAIFNGTPAIVSDRDFIALTFKTTF